MNPLLARLRTPAAVDALLLFGCGAVACYGFHDTFVGWTYLLAGLLGLALGIALAHLATRLGQPVIVLAVLTVATFFLLGGAVALHGLGGTAVLPLPDTLARLADSSVHGWKELLTTLPPVDGGPLLTLPYLLGLVAGATGMSAAERLRSAILPTLVPIALMATVILLGVQTPEQTAVLGAVFAALVVVWAVVRGRRNRTVRHQGGRRLSRRLTAVGLCLGSALLAVALGPQLPGLGDERVVLRAHVEPPFDVGQYPSPLASFRRYTKGYQGPESSRLFEKPLFTVTGLPEGSRVRIAALDAYDGAVWGASQDAGLDPSAMDSFQKVGSVIDNPMAGTPVTATVRVEEGYAGVWLPTAGGLTGLRFSGDDAEQDAEDFRYNLATSTGVAPAGLTAGDEYAFDAVLPEDELTPETVPFAGALPGTDSGARFQQLAAQWGGAGAEPLAQALAAAAHLKSEGAYTDGEQGHEQFAAGHSLRRLSEFVSPASQIAGNDEQYAAMMALLANQLGVPTRVVMGAEVPADGVVRGEHVHAWMEVRAADETWRTLPQSEFMNTERPPDEQSPQPQQRVAGKVVPPPVPVRPPSTLGDPVTDGLNQQAKMRQDDGDGGAASAVLGFLARYVAPPVGLVALLCGLIVGAKSLRRRRRRTRGLPERRLALAWRELLDHARDLGLPAPARATRREQAGHLALAGLPGLARQADAEAFGRTGPTEESVRAFWARVDETRREMSRSHDRRTRVRAALSLASFRSDRGTGATA